MSRFSAGLHKLKEVSGKAPTLAAVESVPEVLATVPDLPPSRRGKVSIAAYFDPAVRKQLAILSVREDRSQAAMIAEALNLLFDRYGEPPIAKP